jgi:hypothetical protein
MEPWGVIFLGIIALASVVQSAFLIGLTLSARKLGRRVDEIQGRIEREVMPTLGNLQRVSRNIVDISDSFARQAQRLDEALQDVLVRVEETSAMVQRVIVRPLGPLVNIIAFIRGLRRGVETFKQLNDTDPERRGSGKRYNEDEHLFI